MTIRRAHPKEFPRIAHLQTESWRASYRGSFSDDFLDNRLGGLLLDRWSAINPGENDLILVEDRGDIMGFIAVRVLDEPVIDNLHVRPEARSQGIGRLLLASAARRLIDGGYTSAHLWVAESNRRAIRFYRRVGGQVVEHAIKQHFGEDLAAIKIRWDALSDILAADQRETKTQ
jgi:ribosomal protein S18 acetylase RimI-like enzyme